MDGGEMLKVVTVLFADVVGSTAQAEVTVPEETRLIMTEFFAAMSEEIKAEGGTIDRFIGDAVMAEFGIPTAHEDDPLRAVRAARRMLERLEKWNLERDESTRLRIRVGINTGTVSIGGSLGDELRVVGDAVNVAARLEQAAAPGSIVVGERTARAIRSLYDLTPLDTLRLKGKSEPVHAFVVGDDLHASLRPGSLEVRAPLIGREAEVARLESVLDQAALQRKPQQVTIIGDGGVGKSRLLQEFTSSFGDRVKLLSGRCSPHGEGPALWPFGEILKDETGVLRTDSTDVALAKLDSYVGRSISPGDVEAGLAVAVLAFTLGIESENSPLAGRDPREIHRELLRVWRALFCSLAERSPLVVIIEDIHWADATVLDVLVDLVRFTEGAIVFVCSARPDLFRNRPEWGTSVPGHSSLSLGCLQPEQSTALITHLLGREALPEEDQRRIVERSEGNPFYLEEIIRRLIDESYIVQEGDHWIVVQNISDLEIPDNVQSVIASRIDLLSPPERKALQLAAVVGRTFWAGALAHLDSSLGTPDVLDRLGRREFIAEQLATSIAGDIEYSFKHALIRDVAYESLPRQSRGQAHATVAKWMEHTAGDRADEVAELLAHHYGMALSYLKQDQESLRRGARRNCLVASRSAVRRFAFKQAESFGRRAVELSSEGAERIEALEALGDSYYVTFDSDGAWSCYCEAITALDDPETDPVATTRLCAKAAIVPTRWWGSMREPPDVGLIRQTIAKGLQANGDRNTKELSILLSSKTFLQIMGYEPIDEAGKRAAQQACDIAESLDDPDLLSLGLDAVAFLYLPRGLYKDVDRITKRRLELADRLNDITETCDIHAMAAWCALHVGRYREAIHEASVCIERAEGVDLGSYLYGLSWRMCARFLAGDWDDALADQSEIEKIESEDDHELPRPYVIRAYGTSALCNQLRGNDAEVGRYLSVCERFHDAHPIQSNLGGDLPAIARTWTHRGEPARAREVLSFEVSDYLSIHLEAMCEAVGTQGDWDEAAHLIPGARKEADRGGILALAHFVDRLEGRSAAAAGRNERARAALERSAVGFSRLGATWETAWSRLLLGEVLAVSGDKQGAEKQATQSLHTFRTLRSPREIERAETLLARL
ncbi:MAG: AAA family ATPase [Actinomycetota bacterium]|nr:AAA family ATPase [Actinomycetota bacterium]